MALNKFQQALSDEFNKVSPKLVKVTEYMDAFEKATKQHLGFLQRTIVNAMKPDLDFKSKKIRDAIAANAGDDVQVYFEENNGKYEETREHAYVHTSLLKDIVVGVAGKHDVPPGMESLAEKMKKICFDALSSCNDHSEKLASGKLKAMKL